MDLNLNESESRYYNDLFTLCDVEKSGKIQYLKATELIRSSGLDNQIVDQVKMKSIYESSNRNNVVSLKTFAIYAAPNAK